MIDFHTHILPGIDDGSKSTEMSLGMLKALIGQGVTDVILTPHFYCEDMTFKNYLDKRQQIYDNFKKDAETYPVKLYLGSEVHISDFKVGDFTDFLPLAIEGTSYILVELPFITKWNEQIFQNLDRLSNDAGLTPVIAHVEKYPAVLSDPGIVDKLIETGCLMQINANSFRIKSRRKLSEKLIGLRKIHCLGSDAHNMTTRYPNYLPAYNAIAELSGKDYADELQNNMRSIIENKKISAETTRSIRKIFWMYV